MDHALRELASLGEEHRRLTVAQRNSLASVRRRSVELLERGVPVEAIATAVGISTIAVAGWSNSLVR